MTLYDSILHPTDFSPAAAAARPLAFELARHGTTLHLLHVESPYGREAVEAAQVMLDAYGAEAPLPAQATVVRDVAAAPAILRHAFEENVDLIVMGTHGRRGLSRLLMGSTAREVVQFAPCPVLTVRDGVEGQALSTLEGKSILAAVDFSEPSLTALAEATHLARTLQARLDVVHVVETPLSSYAGYPTYAIHQPEPAPEAEAALCSDLRAIRDGGAEGHHLLGPIEIVHGTPAEQIREVAGRLGSALIVVGTRGLRGLDHLIMGSVAEALVRTAPCPVLTMKDDFSVDAARTRAQEHRDRGDRTLTWPPAPPITERAR